MSPTGLCPVYHQWRRHGQGRSYTRTPGSQTRRTPLAWHRPTPQAPSTSHRHHPARRHYPLTLQRGTPPNRGTPHTSVSGGPKLRSLSDTFRARKYPIVTHICCQLSDCDLFSATGVETADPRPASLPANAASARRPRPQSGRVRRSAAPPNGPPPLAGREESVFATPAHLP